MLKRLFLLFLLFWCFLFPCLLSAQPPDTLWTRRQNFSESYEFTNALTQTADGGWLPTGFWGDEANPRYLLRLNELGDTMWSRPGGYGAGVLQTNDGGYLIVARVYDDESAPDSSSTWLIRLDADPILSAHQPPVVIPQVQAISVYSNPFNATTTITFTVPSLSVVTNSVFDVTGRCVRTLTDKDFAAGEHHIAFNGGELPSGVYFVHLEAPHFSVLRNCSC